MVRPTVDVIAPIDAAALALLRAVVADVEAGRAVITRIAIHDDVHGQRADLAWAPPATAATSTPSPLAAAFADTRQTTTTAPAPGFRCPRCHGLAEEIPEDNGGGGYCAACDESW